jgi:hypothetical protein
VGLYFCQDGRACEDSRRVGRKRPRHGDENAVNLRLLLIEQPHQLVVLFDRLQRLDEDRLARG